MRIERFSIECRYKNAEVISTANQKKERKCPLTGPLRNQSNNQTGQSAGNAGDQDVIGLNFVTDWLKERREFSGPFIKQVNAHF